MRGDIYNICDKLWMIINEFDNSIFVCPIIKRALKLPYDISMNNCGLDNMQNHYLYSHLIRHEPKTILNNAVYIGKVSDAFIQELQTFIYQQLNAKQEDETMENTQNTITNTAFMTSPIGDLTIDSNGMRKAVDEIARLQSELKTAKQLLNSIYAQTGNYLNPTA